MGFRYLEEGANYSPQGLRKVFGNYFETDEIAAHYAHKPVEILSRAYANRMGNGPEEFGDGWTYRGRGLIMVTGKNNYIMISGLIGIDVVGNPDLLTTPEPAVLSATAFWASRDINKIVDSGVFSKVCKAVNGGTNGLTERTSLYNNILRILG